MKFAFVVGFLSATGGMNRSLQILARHLIAHGHQVDILYWDCPRDFSRGSVIAGQPRQINIFGLSRHNVMSNVFRKLTKLLSGPLRHVFFFYYARIASPALERHLSSNGYDRIFIQDQHYIPVCRLKLPHVIVIHSNWQAAYLRHRLPLFNRLKRKAYKSLLAAKTIYTVSEDVRRHLIDYFSVCAENVRCAYNPIDFQRLSSMANQQAEISLPESYWLASGRLDKTKRFDRLLKAYAASQVTGDLLIMGKGGMYSQLQALARQLGVRRRVRFIGFQSNPMPYYRHARGVISASDCEGLPTVLLESLACGTPVISANCPSGPREILTMVGLESWLVFKPEDWLANNGRPWPQEKEDEIVAELAEKIRLFDRQPPQFNAQTLSCFDARRVASHYLPSGDKPLAAAD